MILLHAIHGRVMLTDVQKRVLADHIDHGRNVRIAIRRSGYVSPQFQNTRWGAGWFAISNMDPAYNQNERNYYNRVFERHEAHIRIVRLNR